jgi:urocanate hydratase
VGLTIVADGNAGTTDRFERVPKRDPGIGVLRNADAN